MSEPLIESSIPELPLVSRGKVRDLYAVGADQLLIVVSDRISAFDVVLPTPVPRKGEVLNKLSIFWFDFLKDVIGTHFLTASVDEYPAEIRQHRDQLEGRSMLVKRLDMYPIECVARGYIVGSGWKDYRRTGCVGGNRLPDDMQECGKLPSAIYTPATKAVTGHDENIDFDESCRIVGAETGARLRDLTLDIYERASQHGLGRGLILADTKLEFGTLDGEIVLGDEVLTPDSSRYWPLELYSPGRAQESFDKQYLRDYLEEVQFNKQPPGPALPDDVANATSEKYLEAYAAITGEDL